MTKFPPGALPLAFAAKKHGFNRTTLYRAIKRGRLKGFQREGNWYTTDRAVKDYLKARNVSKIPKRYREKA